MIKSRVKPDHRSTTSSVVAELDQQLDQGLQELGLSVDGAKRKVLLEYLSLLRQWGQSYNLTGILDPPRMVSHHILDSLATVPYIDGARLLDVGSGAGLPGIPLAVVLPELSVTLLDSRKKRVRFLVHAASTLGLGNIEPVCERVEQYRPVDKFDTLVSRAFSSIDDYINKAIHLCSSDGRMLALKGVYPAAELSRINSEQIAETAVHPLNVPGIAAQRHIVVLTHNSKVLADT